MSNPSIAARPPASVPLPSRVLPRLRAIVDDPVCVLGLFLLIAFLTRAIGLHLTQTSDEGYWMQRSLRFGTALLERDLAYTYRSGHPGVTVMWIGLAGIGPERLAAYSGPRFALVSALQESAAYLDLLASARFALTIVTSLLTAAAAGLAWRLFGRGPGLLGGALLLLDPYLIGSTRLLHVDALLTPLMTVSALAALVYWTRAGSRWYLALSAVSGGLALLTKAPAIFLPLFVGLIGLVHLLTDRRIRPAARTVGAGLIWLLVAAALYVALWPALWVNPLGRLRQVASFAASVGGAAHNWSNFFLGEIVVGDPGPHYYPIALLFRLSPIVLFGLLALLLGLAATRGQSSATTDRPSVRPAGPALWLLVYVALFMAMMTIGAKKFDRYMLPAIAMLDLLAGVGLWWLAVWLGRRPTPAGQSTEDGDRARSGRAPIAAALGVPIVAVAVQAALMVQSYPHPIAFYNPLLGGAAGAQRAILVGWGEGLEQAAAYLDRLPNAERMVVSTHYHLVLRPLFRGETVRIVRPVRLDYFVLYINMVQRNLIPPAVQQVMAVDQPEFTATVNGVEYAWVYRVRTLVQESPGTPEESEEEQQAPD